MTFTTPKTILVDANNFFVGTNTYDKTTTPNNEVKITASDGAASDYFGYSVAVGCGRIVVGAYLDDVGLSTDQGSAYIFDLDGTQLAKITASDGDDDYEFGRSVAVGSGRIVVGAPGDTPNGLVYVYDLDGNNEVKIAASDAAADDFFGRSVAVGSGRIVVGAYGDDDNGSGSGSAYIFDLDGNQLSKITASDAAASDSFGSSVAVGSGRIVVGAPLEDESALDAGSIYIFDLDGNQLTKIPKPNGGFFHLFGLSVAVGCGRIVAGAYGVDTQSNLDVGEVYIFDLDGNQITALSSPVDSQGFRFGEAVAVGSGRIVAGAEERAYIFDLDGNQLAEITASDGAFGDNFGEVAVAVGSGRIVVGAYLDDDNGSNSGSAYIYTTPDQTHYLDLLSDGTLRNT